MKTQTTTRQTYRWIWVALAITGLLSACGEDVAVSSGESLSLEQAALQDVSTSSVKISASGATVTFKLEGLHALPSDLRLRTLALRGMELRFTPVDDSADREELIIALEDLLFDVQDGELRIESPIDLPAPGLYQVRMQARSDSSSKEEQGESSGLSFSGWMNPAASAVPFDVRVFGDMRGDGPNPHPFDGGEDDGAGKPSQSGGDDDPVASSDEVDTRGDGPNPHPFDGGDGTGKPSQPGGDDDPVASGDMSDGPNPHPFDSGEDDGDDPVRPPSAEPAGKDGSWKALSYQDDGSTSLEMGSLHIEEGDSSVELTIFLPAIEATPAQIETAPSLDGILNFSWGAESLPSVNALGEDASISKGSKKHTSQRVQHLGMGRHSFLTTGRVY